MRTIEAMMAQLTARTVVEEVREVLRAKDPEFVAAEENFRKAIAELSSRIGKTSLEELLSTWDQACCSDLVYAGTWASRQTYRTSITPWPASSPDWITKPSSGSTSCRLFQTGPRQRANSRFSRLILQRS